MGRRRKLRLFPGGYLIDENAAEKGEHVTDSDDGVIDDGLAFRVVFIVHEGLLLGVLDLLSHGGQPERSVGARLESTW